MKVSQMTNNNGRAIANQFIVTDHNGNESFQSYDSIIAKREAGGQITLDPVYWQYSKTTSKYRSLFLGETTKETQAKIDNGTYKLANLN
jgi:hypothetical protein